MPHQPLAYPWEWLESTTSVGCPLCGLPSPPLRPSRRRNLTCRGCGTQWNSFSGSVLRPGQPPVVLRSIEQVLHEFQAAANAHPTEAAGWREADASLRLLLERTDDPLPSCRSLLAGEPPAVGPTRDRLAEALGEIRSAIDRQVS